MSDGVITEAEASDRLAEFVDRALAGEAVLISRAGEVVAELRSVRSVTREPSEPAPTRSDWAWLEARRVGSRVPDEDAGTFLERLRNEEQV